MSMTDPIADFLTRVRNAILAKHRMVDIPSSKLKTKMAHIMYEQKLIKNYILIEDGKQNILRIFLKYDKSGASLINELKRVSTPGRRYYVGLDDLPRVKNNTGIAILSTSRGVMSERDARKNSVGGEVLCYIW